MDCSSVSDGGAGASTRSTPATRSEWVAAAASACGAPPENPTTPAHETSASSRTAATTSPLAPVSFHESGRVTVEVVGESASLSEFYAALAADHDAEIERVWEFRRGPTRSDVTDRQRAALEAAVELGYYDVPQTAGVADVARELDCAQSTAGELLRKAESAVVTAFASP